ncbi:hypothetical protein PQX77_021199 [Marasmius sp. AFHP31]|nr:hypothetical protein PQX77_021199 [Marasmius sp. AFHP31]
MVAMLTAVLRVVLLSGTAVSALPMELPASADSSQAKEWSESALILWIRTAAEMLVVVEPGGLVKRCPKATKRERLHTLSHTLKL